MFKASWSKEDGTTSFWTLLVVTLLTLTWARGAVAWGTHFCLKADLEQSGWRSSMIFDMGGAFLQKRTTGAAGRKENDSSSCSSSQPSCCYKRDKQFREKLNKRSCGVLRGNTTPSEASYSTSICCSIGSKAFQKM
jgi:hypothetical protein